MPPSSAPAPTEYCEMVCGTLSSRIAEIAPGDLRDGVSLVVQNRHVDVDDADIGFEAGIGRRCRLCSSGRASRESSEEWRRCYRRERWNPAFSSVWRPFHCPAQADVLSPRADDQAERRHRSDHPGFHSSYSGSGTTSSGYRLILLQMIRNDAEKWEEVSAAVKRAPPVTSKNRPDLIHKRSAAGAVLLHVDLKFLPGPLQLVFFPPPARTEVTAGLVTNRRRVNCVRI